MCGPNLDLLFHMLHTLFHAQWRKEFHFYLGQPGIRNDNNFSEPQVVLSHIPIHSSFIRIVRLTCELCYISFPKITSRLVYILT